MHFTLNFSSEKEKLLLYLKRFPCLEKRNAFEETRCSIGNSVATLYSSGKLLIQGNDAGKVKEKILKELDLGEELVIGIDEAGRGEDSGPFVVAAVLADKNKVLELRDSKKVRNLHGKRELVQKNCIECLYGEKAASEIDALRESGKTLNEIEAEMIDGLVARLRKIAPKAKVKVDGSRLPVKCENVEFIVRGDDLDTVIAAASVEARWQRVNSKDKEKRKSWKTRL